VLFSFCFVSGFVAMAGLSESDRGQTLRRASFLALGCGCSLLLCCFLALRAFIFLLSYSPALFPLETNVKTKRKNASAVTASRSSLRFAFQFQVQFGAISAVNRYTAIVYWSLYLLYVPAVPAQSVYLLSHGAHDRELKVKVLNNCTSTLAVILHVCMYLGIPLHRMCSTCSVSWSVCPDVFFVGLRVTISVDSENVDKRKNKLSEAEIAAQTGILLIGGQDMTVVDH
jgi:hypothetical protein